LCPSRFSLLASSSLLASRFFFSLVLQPAQKHAEHTLGDATATLSAHASEALLDLVYPQDARAHGFGHLNGAADVGFGGTHERPEDAPDIQTKKWHAPRTGERTR